jgi:hypothetical protein
MKNYYKLLKLFVLNEILKATPARNRPPSHARPATAPPPKKRSEFEVIFKYNITVL